MSEKMYSKQEVRCPQCGNLQEIDGDDEIYEEGQHTIYCDECDYEYEIGMSISYTYISPPPNCQHDGDTDVIWSPYKNKDGSCDGDEICMNCEERWPIKVNSHYERID